jgi:hypothetical protein
VTFKNLNLKSNHRGQLTATGEGGYCVIRASDDSIAGKIAIPAGAALNHAILGEVELALEAREKGEDKGRMIRIADMLADNGGSVSFSGIAMASGSRGRLVVAGAGGMTLVVGAKIELRFNLRSVSVGTPIFSMYQEHLVQHGRHVRVHTGDRIRAGEPLIDGLLYPHDVLRISGLEKLQEYLLREVQNVYRAQNVTIDDKHIEIIIMQMMRFVKVRSQGDSNLLPGAIVDKARFEAEKRQVQAKKGEPPKAEPVLQGITKAGLRSESFIAAASFQETTKVLTDAALSARRDDLLGLKENVILGHMIPAGTGFPGYQRLVVNRIAPEISQELPINLEGRQAM